MKHNRVFRFGWILALIVITAAGCSRSPGSAEQTQISVTNTYLKSAVRDLAGHSQEIFCLAPPGMCPGHFDMSPAQIQHLLRSKTLFRFDFQAGLDQSLTRVDLPVVPIEIRPGMGIPETYLDTCRQMIPHLARQFPGQQDRYMENLQQLEKRLAGLENDIRRQIRQTGLPDAKVIASCHQAHFARWLGLDVVAELKGVDSMTPADIEQCLDAGRELGASIVIANLQEGTQLPGRIAEQLNARLVVFSNFPPAADPESSAGGFEQMLLSNIQNLVTD